MFEWLANADPLAAWGALLSTSLAVREIIKARTKIEVGYRFTSLEDEGNLIIIRNLSSHRIIIRYWELVWCKRRLLKWVPFRSIDPGEDNTDILVPEHSSTFLSFTGQDHFDWSYKSLNGGKLFIRVYLAGKKCPVVMKVYG